jgi:hypothetical protein
MDLIHCIVRIYLDDLFRNLFRELLLVDTRYSDLLIINRCLWHFTLKLQKIFHFLQRIFIIKKPFVLLLNFIGQ